MDKNQIKRLIVLMLAAAFGLSMAGCTGEPASSQPNSAALEVSVTDATDSEHRRRSLNKKALYRKLLLQRNRSSSVPQVL